MTKSLLNFTKLSFRQKRFLPRFSRSAVVSDSTTNEESETGIGKLLSTSPMIDKSQFFDQVPKIMQENRHLTQKSKIAENLDEPEFDNDDDTSFLKTKRTFEEHQAHRRHVRYQRELRKNMIREKDTLLTWAAMDQIRELHDKDPQTWTPERIAESFPISIQGARSFLHGKRPKNVTPEVIKEHDEKVAERWQALNSKSQRNIDEDTKILLKTNQMKFLPLKSFHKEEKISAEEKQALKLAEETQKLIDQPNDGPFMKMYRNHLRWKNAAKLDENPTKIKMEDEENKNYDAEEIFQSLMFKNLENSAAKKDQILDEEDKIVMNFKEFREKMKRDLKTSKNRVDRRYGRWIEEQQRNEKHSR